MCAAVGLGEVQCDVMAWGGGESGVWLRSMGWAAEAHGSQPQAHGSWGGTVGVGADVFRRSTRYILTVTAVTPLSHSVLRVLQPLWTGLCCTVLRVAASQQHRATPVFRVADFAQKHDPG